MFVSCAFYTQTVNLNHTVNITVMWDIMVYIIIINIIIVVIIIIVGGVMFIYL
jgi:hypothetical protein